MTEPVPVGYGRTDRLFDLLPGVIRTLDAEQGNALRDLLRVLGEQVAVVEDGITTLGDEPFIETCSDWAVPYLGDLVGWTAVADAGLPALGAAGRDLVHATVLTPRADVANTIRHRRRKGTLALLEELARDVTGWPARAVEFYRLLAGTQHVEHVQAGRGRTVDVRGGGEQAHLVDVRRSGRYAPAGVGVYVWRLKAYPMTGTPAAQAEHVAGPHVFTFDPLYRDVPLFVGRPDGDWPVHPRTDGDVPGPLTRQRLLDHYGPGRSVRITAHDWPARGTTTEIPAAQVRPADLSDWRRYRARPNTVAVDPQRGRILFRPGQAPSRVTVSYFYGFPADLGGGEYDRRLPQLPARAVVRFTAGQLADPATVIVAVRDRPDDVTRVVHAHWPAAGRAPLGAYDPAKPPTAALVDHLLAALDAAVADPALHRAAVNIEPPRGDALLIANRAILEKRFAGLITIALYVAEPAATGDELADRLQQWRTRKPRYAVFELTRSDIYDTRVSLDLADGQQVTIRAANRCRPIVWLPDRRPDRADSLSATLQPGCRLILDGLTLTGRAVRLTGVPGPAGKPAACAPTRITMRHCTLLPGRVPNYEGRDAEPPPPALELADLPGAIVEVSHSVVGAVAVSGPPHTAPLRLSVADSVVDGTRADHGAIGRPGEGVPPLELRLVRSTVRGTVLTNTVTLVEDAIIDGELAVVRRRTGCVRFSHIPAGSCTPRRFRCQPDLAVAALGPAPDPGDADRERIRVRPRFTGTEYGHPGYLQLAPTVAEEIRRGASDDSEMGVYHDLYQPQRLANLAARLDEYTPAGMQPDPIIVT
jgi:hypothetical protein